MGQRHGAPWPAEAHTSQALLGQPRPQAFLLALVRPTQLVRVLLGQAELLELIRQRAVLHIKLCRTAQPQAAPVKPASERGEMGENEAQEVFWGGVGYLRSTNARAATEALMSLESAGASAAGRSEQVGPAAVQAGARCWRRGRGSDSWLRFTAPGGQVALRPPEGRGDPRRQRQVHVRGRLAACSDRHLRCSSYRARRYVTHRLPQERASGQASPGKVSGRPCRATVRRHQAEAAAQAVAPHAGAWQCSGQVFRARRDGRDAGWAAAHRRHLAWRPRAWCTAGRQGFRGNALRCGGAGRGRGAEGLLGRTSISPPSSSFMTSTTMILKPSGSCRRAAAAITLARRVRLRQGEEGPQRGRTRGGGAPLWTGSRSPAAASLGPAGGSVRACGGAAGPAGGKLLRSGGGAHRGRRRTGTSSGQRGRGAATPAITTPTPPPWPPQPLWPDAVPVVCV